MKKGSVLIASLFLTIILMILGMAFLAVKASQYKKSTMRKDYALVNSIARAGMEDARIKMEKDQDFPPPGDDDQKVFSYWEIFYDIDGITILGTYCVTIDSTMAAAPYQIVKITSIGFAGPLEKPVVKKKIEAELDIAQKMRTNPNVANPDYFKLVNWQESGTL
jgi:hypothetical protein